MKSLARSMFSSRSLRTQLIVYIMVISLAVLAGASYFIFSYMQRMVKDQNERLLYQQFQQLDHNITGLVSEVDRLSLLFLRDDSIQRFLYKISEKTEIEFLESKNDVQRVIADFIDNYSYIDSVYITADNLGVVGGSATRTLVYSKEEWQQSFFSSEPFRRTLEMYPKLIIEAGIQKSFYNPYLTGPDNGHLISLMRGTRAIYDPTTSATLIFNIDERYLVSIYATALNKAEGDMYIVNGSGRIVSSSVPERIGTSSPFVPDEQEGVQYGSFDGHSAGRSVQVVYYKLTDGGWYLLKEIPLSQYSEQIYGVQRMLVIVFILSVLVIFIVSYFWLRRIIKPLHLLSLKMKDMSRGELGVTLDHIPNNELGTVIRRFNEMSLSMVELVDKNNEIQEKKRELEIEALQYQINPHFLYNTLNMIRWMAVIVKADNIVQTIVALGNMLRPVFSSKDSMCTLRDELSYLDNYMKIINMRFNNSIAFEVEVDEALMDCQVPRFILQPLLENSIASGRQNEELAIRIGIGAELSGETLQLIVTDSGTGLDVDKVRELNDKLATGESPKPGGGGSGIGLNNVNKRIHLYYGPDYGVHFVAREHGAEVRVSLQVRSGRED
ncbi:cache domain-containing sensor histidine kinase [Paenibacillus piscarius]|uniref:cache domain-containing sensor histidine kinase n=1 Tax=Paenibacillus piscarius TaxID=1089681 RepID=UPI001EE983D3|nr:histidine kinase [Paenibacillus piscarius]